MALARKEDFPDRDMLVSEWCKALAHPARLAILMALAERKDCICGELVSSLPLAQSTVSQHLKALKELGLIKGVIDGPRSRYCIDWKMFDRYRKHFGNWIQNLEKLRQDNCC